MPTLTRFMMQSYTRGPHGSLSADEPVRFYDKDSAEQAAVDAANKKAGSVAYVWTGDFTIGDGGKISVLCCFGEMPIFAAIALGLEYHSA